MKKKSWKKKIIDCLNLIYLDGELGAITTADYYFKVLKNYYYNYFKKGGE